MISSGLWTGSNELTFPVPFLARARISRPERDIGIDCSWIGLGRSNPAV